MSLIIEFVLRRMLRSIVALVFCCVVTPAVQAHLMVAQSGTLNIVGNGGYAVMSLPVDAFTGIDDDGDGLLSLAEMRAHSSEIEAQVLRGLVLVNDSGACPLEGLMLNLSPDDNAPTAPAQHLVILGRFALGGTEDQALSGLKLRFSLFGKDEKSQKQEITITHGTEKQKLVLSPSRPESAVFASVVSVILNNALLGAEHVLSGLDHLLFLLVVLATGWGIRQIAIALTCFTMGHAITLTASVLGSVSVPANIVEPAIAATIVGIALFDRWSQRQKHPSLPILRLCLIFACALIHGLGFAGALTDLGLESNHRIYTLIGFNVGIEIAQLGVALLAAGVMFGVNRFIGASGVTATTRFASLAAIAVGSIWFVQRLIVPV
jgi:hypothetical protein